MASKPAARPSKSSLETFPNPSSDRDYTIRMRIPEFTCLCPKTGQPDFATLYLEYVPDAKCIELKSLKLYVWSYRRRRRFSRSGHQSDSRRPRAVDEAAFHSIEGRIQRPRGHLHHRRRRAPEGGLEAGSRGRLAGRARRDALPLPLPRSVCIIAASFERSWRPRPCLRKKQLPRKRRPPARRSRPRKLLRRRADPARPSSSPLTSRPRKAGKSAKRTSAKKVSTKLAAPKAQPKPSGKKTIAPVPKKPGSGPPAPIRFAPKPLAARRPATA